MSKNNTNHCIFSGNLGRDPEIRYLDDGTAVCDFPLAVGWKTKTKEGTEWVNCVAWGKLAEICGEYLKKGAFVIVEGQQRTRSWEKDGQKHYKTETVLDKMEMAGPREG
jgi:single-strand DNA-binding protein